MSCPFYSRVLCKRLRELLFWAICPHSYPTHDNNNPRPQRLSFLPFCLSFSLVSNARRNSHEGSDRSLEVRCIRISIKAWKLKGSTIYELDCSWRVVNPTNFYAFGMSSDNVRHQTTNSTTTFTVWQETWTSQAGGSSAHATFTQHPVLKIAIFLFFFHVLQDMIEVHYAGQKGTKQQQQQLQWNERCCIRRLPADNWQ